MASISCPGVKQEEIEQEVEMGTNEIIYLNFIVH